MTVKASQVHKIEEELEAIKERLESLHIDKEETLNNAESAASPNEERLDILREQEAILSDAIADLEVCIDTLSTYL